MNFITSTLGRFLLSVPFIANGLGHFTQTQMYAGAVPSWLPAPAFWVYLTGLALLAAALSFNIRKYDRLAGLLAALLVASFAVFVHLPGLMKAVDPADASAGMMKMFSMVNFLKDLGLSGGALILASTAKEAKG